ncbi:hypothetical protein HMPREF1577_00397 [Gardnerella pickettii JCP8017A]|uniref:Uncharacterized protein n=1 Tax=Gardnerella pickettii JCP8017A TaxID=1261062 RepID=T2PLE0_9BIFI|nr:hypothetical protein HMPREF1577_00397 [Gardnerella pickettii JCP8017A]EPI62297.1 hypothetical protein HMPREF1578_00132 [Gardnerella pickettii JCP8017B]
MLHTKCGRNLNQELTQELNQDKLRPQIVCSKCAYLFIVCLFLEDYAKSYIKLV